MGSGRSLGAQYSSDNGFSNHEKINLIAGAQMSILRITRKRVFLTPLIPVHAVRLLGVALVAAVSTAALAVNGSAQIAAPASLPPCLIQFNSYSLGNGNSWLILFNSDHTWLEINSHYQNPLGSGTIAPIQGTYTYAVDPQNPSHATIGYSATNPGFPELYFTAPNSGQSTPPNQISIVGTTFTLYPSQLTNGNSNFSNRCVLASGGSSILGFVVQSGGPRWVLLRAVGASLSSYGTTSGVTSPSLTVYDSSQAVMGTSTVWSADPNLVGGYQKIFSIVGAFPLSTGSDEGVLLLPLNPGAYTAAFSAGSAGTILCEAYMLPF
jgi:hypothetical protein